MAKVAGDGVALLYACIIMLTLAWVFAMLRLGVRKWKNNFGLDDWLMFAGLALYSVTVGLVIRCCFYGAGQKSKNLEPYDMMMGTKVGLSSADTLVVLTMDGQLFFVAQFFYCACSVPIKTSICVTMLRICDSRRRFVYTIRGIIAMTILTAIVFIIAVANVCHPIERLWGETTRGSCNTSLNSSIGFFFSAVSIITDWTLAILPAVLLWKIQMKQRVKLPVICMLSLGVL